MPVPLRVERRAVEQGRQVERGQGVQDDDFVRGVGVDALCEREERAGVVEGLVECGVGRGVATRESREVLVQVAFSLGGGDGGARTVVVVEGEVVVVFVVEEVLLGRG